MLPSRGELRLSQHREDYIKLLKPKILGRYTDKYMFFDTTPYDLELHVNEDTRDINIFDPISMNTMAKLNISPESKPTILYTGINSTEKGETRAHALLLISFPRENMIDIVSTYSLDEFTIDTIQEFSDILYHSWGVYNYYPGRRLPTINDVSCLSAKPMKLRNKEACYALQSEDTADIGWCAAWMVKFSEELSKKTQEEFWNQPWEGRRIIYKQLYDSFVTLPNFNSMEIGREIWNSMIITYRGGKTRRYRNKRKTRRKNAPRTHFPM